MGLEERECLRRKRGKHGIPLVGTEVDGSGSRTRQQALATQCAGTHDTAPHWKKFWGSYPVTVLMMMGKATRPSCRCRYSVQRWKMRLSRRQNSIVLDRLPMG